jgi:BlaI family penicillinase repressor
MQELMMPRTPQDVTDAELGVLQVLWEKGPCSRREIADALYGSVGPAQYATVQKLLERLQDKGHVARESRTGPLRFRATLGRDQLIGQRLLDVADKLCGGSVTPLLMNLVQAKRLTERELRELRDYLAELGRQKGRK